MIFIATGCGQINNSDNNNTSQSSETTSNNQNNDWNIEIWDAPKWEPLPPQKEWVVVKLWGTGAYDIPWLIADFSKIDSVEVYKNFLSSFHKEHIAVILMRAKNKEAWLQLWGLDYQINDTLKQAFPTQEDFLKEMERFYTDALAWKITFPNEKHDLGIVFSNESLETLLGYCTKEKNPELTMLPKECSDAVYMYRATEDNNYCSKVEWVEGEENQNVSQEICKWIVFHLK